MAASDFTGIVGCSGKHSHGGGSCGIHTRRVEFLLLRPTVCGFVSFAAQPIAAAAGVELGHTSHLRFHAEFGKEATSFALGLARGT